MIIENAVAPRGSELGKGTRSWTTSISLCVRTAAVKVSCKSVATEGLAALATSSRGDDPGRNAP
jgi:hypothetical protein